MDIPLTCTVVAALPAASNVSLLAERFGADNGRVARVILWSTALAFFSFSTAVALRSSKLNSSAQSAMTRRYRGQRMKKPPLGARLSPRGGFDATLRAASGL